MSSWIQRAKATLQQIVEDVVESAECNLRVRVCFVGYRDHGDQERFTIHEFTEDIHKLKAFISGVKAEGGGDFPEDVVGGQRKCLDQQWTANSTKQVFHIFDAPCHGREYYSGWGDNYPDGSPEGYKLEPLMKEFKDRNISYVCIKLNEECNKMIDAMVKSHPGCQVTDLANASATKSADEVTKMFVDSASYNLRASIGGKGKGKASSRKAAKTGKPLWDPKKLAVDDFFSCISYLKVEKVDGN